MRNSELLDQIASALDEVRANVGHADAQHNPWALQALSAADTLLRVVTDVIELTMSTDGDELDVDEELPVGEFQRVIHERLSSTRPQSSGGAS